MSWVTQYSSSQRSIEQRCADLQDALNTRPDAGKLWRNIEKFGRIVNNKGPKLGSFL